jgi:predicted nucleotidyltransferase
MSEPQLPQTLLRVIASLTEWLKDQHVPYAIIGGAAIGFLAQPRATQDIEELIERAIEFIMPELTVRVATPEDLIITKAVAHRKRDLLDIDNLVSVYPNLDLARIRYWVGQFAAVLESPELINDIENLFEGRH